MERRPRALPLPLPNQYALANRVDHPRSVYLREYAILRSLDAWLSGIFDPANLDGTIAALTAVASNNTARTEVERCRHALADQLRTAARPLPPHSRRAPIQPSSPSGRQRSKPNMSRVSKILTRETKAQGITCDQAFVLGSDALYREWGYTALSRGRHTNRLYLVDGRDSGRDDAHTHTSTVQPDPLRRLGDGLGRSRGQTLAVDHPISPVPDMAIDRRAERRQRLEAQRDHLAARLDDRRSMLANFDARLAEASRGLRRYTHRNDRQLLEQQRSHVVGDVGRLTDDVDELEPRIDLLDQARPDLISAVESHPGAHGLDRPDASARPDSTALHAHEEPG